eukprot:3833883-Amphidinium_carterae.1
MGSVRSGEASVLGYFLSSLTLQDQGKLQYLDTFGESWGLVQSNRAVTFMDNHDTQRGEA